MADRHISELESKEFMLSAFIYSSLIILGNTTVNP